MELRVLLESTLAGLGYELVDLELARGGLMRLFIDSPPGKLKLRLPQDGARRISGVLQGLDGEVIRVESDGKLIEVPLSNLDKARLDPKF